jgi:GT2 family glycosyltransferase
VRQQRGGFVGASLDAVTASGGHDLVDGAGTRNVSAVVVNFNGGPLLARGVESILSSPRVGEIFVVDNGSSDGSLAAIRCLAERDQRLRLIENQRNLGFAVANNLGLRRGVGEYCLLVNPDCIIEPDAVELLVSVMAADPSIGMAGCMIRNPDGGEQRGARRRVPTPWRSLVDILHLNALFPGNPRFRGIDMQGEPLGDGPVEVEALSGALMLVRRSALNDVGTLDEGYFLHCEDLDWCMRFRQKGWKIVFVPTVSVVHDQGTCSRSRPIFVEWHKHRGMMRFYRKFFRTQHPSALMGLVAVGVWIHFALLASAHAMRHMGRILGIVRG